MNELMQRLSDWYVYKRYINDSNRQAYFELNPEEREAVHRGRIKADVVRKKNVGRILQHLGLTKLDLEVAT